MHQKQNDHRLRRERLARGWTQQQLADFAHVSLNSVVRAEQGRALRVDICRLLCDCLGKEKPADLGLWSFGQPVPFHTSESLPGQNQLEPETGLVSSSTERAVSFAALPERESVESQERLFWLTVPLIADTQVDSLYDGLEPAIMKVVLAWTRQHEALSALQMGIRATMKEFDHMAQPKTTDETKVSRRYALKAIAKLPIYAYGLNALGLERVVLPSAEELLPLYAAGLVALRTLAQENDLTPVEHVLADYLPVLEKLAHQSSPHQTTAAHLAGQGYLLKVLSADSHRKLDLMEAYSKIAREYGRLAQDPDLEVAALARLAVKFSYEGHDVKSLHIYQEAEALPGFARVSPLLQGRIYAGLAQKYATCQQENKALSVLGMARDIFPTNPQDDPSFHFAYSNKDTLPLCEGHVYKNTGQYAQAWETYTTLGQLQPVSGLLDRNRTEFIKCAASVALLQGELQTSFTYLKAAEDLAWTIKHEQRYAEVLDTYRLMKGLYPREQATRDMGEILNSRQ